MKEAWADAREAGLEVKAKFLSSTSGWRYRPGVGGGL